MKATDSSRGAIVSVRAITDRVTGLTLIGQSESDTPGERVRKSLLVAVSLMILPAAALWGGIYWTFGERIAASFAWGYLVFSVLALVAFSFNRDYRFLRTAELLLILIAPFLVSVSLGGIAPSGGVVLWCLLAPLGAIVFDGPRRAWSWFAVFLVLLLASIPPIIRSSPVLLPEGVILAFAALNIGAVSVIAFMLLVRFAQQRAAAQRRVEDLLLNILPKEIAERLQSRLGTIADQYEETSILFADVVNFTPLSSSLTPGEIVSLLDRLFSDFDELVDAYGLEKIKTIGDCYMVAAGVPRRRDDHAHALARMALDMQECAARYSRADDHAPVQLRIGINSGPVVAGVIGRRRFLYDLWGDAVNTASRMESHGSPGQIQITNATRELIKDDFVCEKRGMIDVKGKGQMETWTLVGLRDD